MFFKNYYQLVQICAFIQKYLKEKVEHLSGVELIEVNIDIDQIAIIKNGEIVEKRTTKVKNHHDPRDKNFFFSKMKPIHFKNNDKFSCHFDSTK